MIFVQVRRFVRRERACRDRGCFQGCVRTPETSVPPSCQVIPWVPTQTSGAALKFSSSTWNHLYRMSLGLIGK